MVVPTYGQVDCKKVYDELKKVYEAYQGSNTYLKFTSQLTDKSGQAEKVLSEVWNTEGLIRYKTYALDVYQDTSHQVIVSHSNQAITLMNTPKGAVKNTTLLQQHFISYDSLRTIGTNVHCEKLKGGTKRLVLYISTNEGTEYHTEKQFTYVFDAGTKRLISLTEEYKHKGVLAQKNDYQFLSYKTNVNQKNKNALSVVYTQGVLKPVYKAYKIIDIR